MGKIHAALDNKCGQMGLALIKRHLIVSFRTALRAIGTTKDAALSRLVIEGSSYQREFPSAFGSCKLASQLTNVRSPTDLAYLLGTMVRTVLTAIAATSISVAVAQATTAYDGSWSLTIITQRGDCDASYHFQVDVRNGVVSHPNIVRLNGRVKANGAVRVSVAVPGKFAAGSGRLNGGSGGGRWSGRSETSKCSGIWSAQRY